MAIIITNEANTVKFDLGNDTAYHIDKTNLSIKKRFGRVVVHGEIEEGVSQKVSLKYTDVSSPVFASNDDMISTILGYKVATAEVVGSVEVTDGVETLAINPDGSINTTTTFTPAPGNEIGNVQITNGSDELDLKTNPHTSEVEALVNMPGHVCDNNSSTTPLDSAGTFTGSWEDTIDYGTIIIGVKSDVDSATDGLKIQWSSDGVTVHDDDVFSIMANNGKVFTFQPVRRYFRLVYVNGGSGQSSFNLESSLRRYYIKPSSHRINDSIVADDDAELSKSVITGQDPKGAFQNVQVSDNGNFKINIAHQNVNITGN